MFNILIVHYNTPELTEACIKSIYKQVPHRDFKLYIFENSDRRPLKYRTREMKILDNRKGQLIDFQKFIDSYPDKLPTTNNYGSPKHMVSIDKCFNLIPDGFILLDSDVLLKRDISKLVHTDAAFVAEVIKERKGRPRIAPYVCYINVPLCRQHGIRFYDPDRTWALYKGCGYDTGASFLEDCVNEKLTAYKIKYKNYVIHLGRASYRDRNIRAFLREYESLWS